MKFVSAILCDAATVREGLLHVLGGGLNYMQRESFPAPLNADVAFLAGFEAADLGAGTDHETLTMQLTLQGDEPQIVAQVEGEFAIHRQVASVNSALAPLVFSLKPVALPAPGEYRLDIQLADARTSLTFVCALFDGEDLSTTAASGFGF